MKVRAGDKAFIVRGVPSVNVGKCVRVIAFAGLDSDGRAMWFVQHDDPVLYPLMQLTPQRTLHVEESCLHPIPGENINDQIAASVEVVA
jgi:hypothetical protein